jgi:hypothetical protein
MCFYLFVLKFQHNQPWIAKDKPTLLRLAFVLLTTRELLLAAL